MARATGALTRATASAVGAVVTRPSLWRAALRQARVLAPTGWWRRPPFLPTPDRAWLAFRLTTAYGDPTAPIVAEDLVRWLRWSDTVQPARRTSIRPDEIRN